MARSGLQASDAPSCQRRRVGAANLAPHSCHDRPVSCQLILERLALFLPPSPLRVACLVLAGLSLCGLGRMRTITAINPPPSEAGLNTCNRLSTARPDSHPAAKSATLGGANQILGAKPMAGEPVVHIGENSPEYRIPSLSRRGRRGKEKPRRKRRYWCMILDTYAECLLAVRNPLGRQKQPNRQK